MAKFRKPKPDLRGAAKAVAAAGRTGADGKKDTEIVHVNKDELPVVDRALRRYGGAGSRNPKTGAKEYVAAANTPGKGTSAGGLSGNTASGSSGGTRGGSGSKEQSIPPTQASPTGSKENLGAAGATFGAGNTEPLGSAGNAGPVVPGGRAPGEYKPGDVPAVKGADALGIGARIAGGIGGAVGSALGQGLTGQDPTEKMIGKEHFGTQVGFSGTGDETGARAGKTTGNQSLGTAEKTAGAKAAGSNATTSASSSGTTTTGSSDDGETITVNPDGTIRTQDTSVAGLRAKRRYGSKTTATVV